MNYGCNYIHIHDYMYNQMKQEQLYIDYAKNFKVTLLKI